MPGMYFENDFDLTSFARGAVEKELLLPQKNIGSGDVMIGLLSPSLNSAAIDIIRRLASKLNLDLKSPLKAPFSESSSVEQILLSPCGIYVDSLLPLMKEGFIKSAAYVNREGLLNHVEKMLPKGYAVELDATKWAVPPIFQWISENANFAKEDMLRNFNLGLEMVVIVDGKSSEKVLNHLAGIGKAAAVVGVVKNSGEGHMCVEINSFNDKKSCVNKQKVAVLTSHNGTNLNSLIEHVQNPNNLSCMEIAVIVTDEDGENLKLAHETKIQIKVLEKNFYKESQSIEDALAEILASFKVDIICVDTFQSELSKQFLDTWKGKVLNIHPSILPAFEGLDVHRQVLNMGARVTGCTVHMLQNEGLNGSILDQAVVSVDTRDTEDTLHKKVSELQQSIFPKVLEKFASGCNVMNNQSRHIFSSPFGKNFENIDKKIRSLMQSTKRPGFLDSDASSCGVFDLKAAGYYRPYLVSGTDGVGTKLKIAQTCNKHDTIGIDLVAMCVNDILTHGAEPLFFLDAFDCGKVNPETVVDVVSGIAEGCRRANCALVGTEINEIPDIYLNPKQCLQEFDKYDVVGYSEGALQKENLLPRLDQIAPGDVLIGLASSGIHSNGYSLIRKLIDVKNLRYQDKFPLDPTKTLQDVLLEPTKIYVRSVLPLMKKGCIKAAAHITGGGLTQNIPRVLPPSVKAVLEGSSWQMPAVLQWVAMEARMSEEEMLQTFNCGLGMVLIVDKKHEKEVLTALRGEGETASTVGFLSALDKGSEQVEVKNFKIPTAATEKRKKKVGVLISGSGTNLQALIDYTQDPNNCSSAEIVLVLSNVPDVEGLTRASRAGIPTKVLSHKEFKKRVDFDMAVHEILKESGVEIVCLAGFMRIVSKQFVELWKGNLLNVHPALLPAFKGANAHKLVLEAGAKVTGCTVHFVEAEVDAGAIILQAATLVDPGDTEKTIQEKVKVLEHQIFPKALELLASDKISRNCDGKLKWNF